MSRTIELGQRSYPTAPITAVRRLDLATSYPGNDAPLPRRIRWAFGVVGLLWADKPLGWPTFEAAGYDLVRLGEEVQAGLDNAGIDIVAEAPGVMRWAVECFEGAVASPADVARARDFSSPPKGETSDA